MYRDDPARISTLMIRPIAAWSILLLLLLPLAAGAQAPAAPPANAGGTAARPARNSPELRLEQRLLSLDLVAYKETRQREGLARQRVTDVLGRLDQALASDAVSLGTLESAAGRAGVARGAAHTAEDQLNGQLERMGERLRRIALLDGGHRRARTRGRRPDRALAGDASRRRTSPPPSISASTALWSAGLPGRTAAPPARSAAIWPTASCGMQRFDARGGFDSTWEGTVANGRITGIWTGNELVTGQPNRGRLDRRPGKWAIT